MYDGLHAHLHAPGPQVPRGARRHRRDRRQTLAGIPRARRLGRGRHRVLRRRRLRGEPRDGRGAAAGRRRAPRPPRRCAKVATPGMRRPSTTVAAFLKIQPDTLREDAAGRRQRRRRGRAACVRGDHELNAVKAQKLPGVASPLRMASAEQRARRPAGREPGLRRAGRAQVLACTPITARCALRRLRLRREREGRALHRRELGPRPARARPSADLRNVVAGDPEPDRQGHAARSRAASRSATSSSSAEVQRGHEGARCSMNPGKRDHACHGLLRHRCDAHRGRGHRTESR